MTTLPTNATRDAARQAQERFSAVACEIDLDFCTRVYGIAPCQAGVVTSGTAQAGASSTITLAAGASAVTNAYVGMRVYIVSGTGAGQESKVTAYNGTTKVATVSPSWTTAPAAGSTYRVIDRRTACYNTWSTCTDKANYAKTVKTYKFISCGSGIPPGETARPYIEGAGGAVAEIDPDKGLATRNSLTMSMRDETDSDVEQDPYIVDRTTAASGTFWSRLMRRNPNYVGRFARVRRGYVVRPWSWLTFLDELYIVDVVSGPDRRGKVKVTLKDPLKFADRNKVPTPTDGKLAAVFPALINTDYVVSATPTTVVLGSGASAVDGAYVNAEVYISVGMGFGQKRVITAYTGATRTATVAAWVVQPVAGSVYEVSPLRVQLPSGKAAQYADPVATGNRQFVRIDEEIVEYTSKSGDDLVLSSSGLRAQFGTTRKDHSAGQGVQQCRVFVDTAVTTVIKSLLNDSGLLDAYIDTAALTLAEADYYGPGYNVTVCLSEPESPSVYLAELLPQISGVMWWSPQLQKAEFKAILPAIVSPPSWSDDATLIRDSVDIEREDAARITYAAVYYGLFSATSNRSEAKYFGQGEIVIDTDAEAATEYGDRRAAVTYSRWFGANNQAAMLAYAARKLNRLRDAPKRLSAEIDPKDYTLPAGEFVDVTTAGLVDDAGNPVATRLLITKVEDRGGRIAIEAVTTGFKARYGYVAPNATADYPTEKVYAHVAANTGLMNNGDEPYRVI